MFAACGGYALDGETRVCPLRREKMDTAIWVVLAIVALVVIGVLAWFAMTRRRTGQLREVFGPEYDRTVEEKEDRRTAESELLERRRRIEGLDIRPLDPTARSSFADRWQAVQARFVDDPKSAVEEADDLVTQVMGERGYPMEDFDQRAADVSVDHPRVVEDYRAAHGISERVRSDDATTEDMRQALVHYRALFSELLEEGNTEEGNTEEGNAEEASTGDGEEPQPETTDIREAR
jgi:hypothetical protein